MAALAVTSSFEEELCAVSCSMHQSGVTMIHDRLHSSEKTHPGAGPAVTPQMPTSSSLPLTKLSSSITSSTGSTSSPSTSTTSSSSSFTTTTPPTTPTPLSNRMINSVDSSLKELVISNNYNTTNINTTVTTTTIIPTPPPVAVAEGDEVDSTVVNSAPSPSPSIDFSSEVADDDLNTTAKIMNDITINNTTTTTAASDEMFPLQSTPPLRRPASTPITYTSNSRQCSDEIDVPMPRISPTRGVATGFFPGVVRAQRWQTKRAFGHQRHSDSGPMIPAQTMPTKNMTPPTPLTPSRRLPTEGSSHSDMLSTSLDDDNTLRTRVSSSYHGNTRIDTNPTTTTTTPQRPNSTTAASTTDSLATAERKKMRNNNKHRRIRSYGSLEEMGITPDLKPLSLGNVSLKRTTPPPPPTTTSIITSATAPTVTPATIKQLETQQPDLTPP